MDEVTELLDYLNEHPTAAQILASVYEVKTRSTKLRHRNFTESEFESSMNEAAMVAPDFFNNRSVAPEGFGDSFRFAEEMKKKCKLDN